MAPQHECATQTEAVTPPAAGGWRPSTRSDASIAAVSAALTGSLDERQRMARLARCLVPAIAESCLIALVDPHNQLQLAALAAEIAERENVLRAGWEEQTATPIGAALVDRALRMQAPTIVERPPHEGQQLRSVEAADSFLEALGWRSALLTPIIVQERAVGVIALGSTAPGRYDERCRRWMGEVGRRAATAIENARLYAAERAARAEAEAAIRARDELTALISHDLRNPLAVVQGQTELLLRQLQQPEPEGGRLLRGIEAVKVAAAQMRLLLDDLHDATHLRAGQPLRLEREPVDLVALARRIATLQQIASIHHDVHLDAAFPELWCVCDQRRIERVLTNLVGNAMKFSPAGGLVTLTVGQEMTSAGLYATLIVADKGVGIPPEDLPHIFEPFHRGQNVRPIIRGTGLGLTSVQTIVAAHDGQITVVSTEGAGSTFTVRLPVNRGESAVSSP